ncbi:glycoside hydrolase family 172 protein [Lentisphaerota bacterium WC36G]|nr:DUF2961 domain-containing protein [Lentisphaerae bacterium WC36]
MKKLVRFFCILGVVTSICGCTNTKENFKLRDIDNVYKMPAKNVQTRWVSAENMTGEKGQGAKTNKGAKGDAYLLIAPGEKKVIFDQKGAGIITKIWSANNLRWNYNERRKVSIEMYWDNAEKPAVDVPLFDFFGNGLSVLSKFESALFASPEGKSHNCFIKMPYKKAAKIVINNKSNKIMMFYFKINFLKLDKLPDDTLYFHAYWHRDLNTKKGEDFEILPPVKGIGRFIGSHIGVIGNPKYKGSWFGEGEVKIYLDGDKKYPTLAGTGTEDYIGTGWGQGQYANHIQGSLISDKKHDIYSFYRYHLVDPVYFHKDIKVTIQQMGNANKNLLMKIRKRGDHVEPLWSYVRKDGLNASKRYLDMENPPKLEDKNFPVCSTTYYRSDDVCATAYFYLNTPESNLPKLQSIEERNKDMAEKVYKFHK